MEVGLRFVSDGCECRREEATCACRAAWGFSYTGPLEWLGSGTSQPLPVLLNLHYVALDNQCQT